MPCSFPNNRPSRLGRAFSLVEIMIVIVIIGLLASVVTVNVRSSMTKAKVNIAKHEIATIVDALNQYWSENGSYPSGDQGLASLHQKSEKSAEPYLSKEPVDPWGKPYVYNSPGRKGQFEVICVGASDHSEISSDDLAPKDTTK